MEKKNYERPVMEVIRMEQEDVICTSMRSNDFGGEDAGAMF